MSTPRYETHKMPHPMLPFIYHRRFELVQRQITPNWHENIELLQCTEGEFRAFALLGATGGAVLYFCAGTALLQPVWAFWADTLFAWGELLLRPVRALWQLGKKFVLSVGNRPIWVIRLISIQLLSSEISLKLSGAA